MLESDIVKRIKPPELMQSAWKKPNKKELAPGITELITWFNKVRLLLLDDCMCTNVSPADQLVGGNRNCNEPKY